MAKSSPHRSSPAPSADWTLAEHLAFECALVNDEQHSWQELKRRDANTAVPDELLQAGHRRAIARHWLSARLQQDSQLQEASRTIHQALDIAGQLLAVGGFCSGLLLAAAALAYTGQAPINVSAFFSVFIVLQAFLALLVALPFLLPRASRERLAFGPLFRLGRGLFNLFYKITQTVLSRWLGARQRQQAAEITAEVMSRLTLHQDVLKWVVFRKTQLLALGFNLGALVALLAAVVFTDRAFGWQTTLEVPATAIHSLVQTIATPWAWWYGEGVGFPDLAQIESSRIRLKDGIAALSSEGLTSWWRFLALGIITYSIAPRVFLCGLSRLQLRRALNRYNFRNAAAEKLFARLLPVGGLFETSTVAKAAPAAVVPVRAGELPLAGDREQTIFAFCSAELAGGIDFTQLQNTLARHWRLPDNHVALRVYRQGDRPDVPERYAEQDQFALVFESWLPPIKEIERQIRDLRGRLQARSLIRIVLLGIPQTEGEAVTLATEARYADTWEAFVRSQGDAYLLLDNPAQG